MTLLRRAALIALVAACLGLVLTPATQAQEEPPMGRITGTVVAGTEGAEPGDVLVRLLALEAADVVDDFETTASDGAFAFEVPVMEQRSYVVTTQYQGVQYILPAVGLSEAVPEASVELTLYEATEEAPELRILETVVTVVALDRAQSEIWLRREDTIAVPGDRVFAGDDTGVTLRIPAPEGTTEVNGGTLDGGVVATAGALFPGERNVIVTAYIVRYDPADDRYGVRATAPLPTEHMELRVPEGYVQQLEPLEGAAHGDPVDAPGAEDVLLEVVTLDGPIEPGRGLLVDLVGLAGPRTVHPLTEQPGAGIAAAVALALITGAAAFVWRRQRIAPGGPA